MIIHKALLGLESMLYITCITISLCIYMHVHVYIYILFLGGIHYPYQSASKNVVHTTSFDHGSNGL